MNIDPCRCMACAGSGRRGWFWRRRKCERCNGKGRVPPPEPSMARLDEIAAQYKAERALKLRQIEEEELARERGRIRAREEAQRSPFQ